MPNEKRDEEALCGSFIKSTQQALCGEGVDKKMVRVESFHTLIRREFPTLYRNGSESTVLVSPKFFIIVLQILFKHWAE